MLARELSTFQKTWNKDKQYKSYEKAAKKLEKETKKEEYTCWLQQQFVESMMGATSMLEILFDGDTRKKAFLWEAMEKELDKAATEEIIETVAIIALTKGYGSLVKAADTAGDVAKTAKRLDTVADTLDNLSDAERALDKIRDVEKIDDVTDTVKSIDRVDDLNDALRGTERVVEGGSGSKFKDVFDLADNYNLSDDTFNNHILDRHGPNSLYGNKSHFNTGFDIKNGIDSTLKGDNFIIKSNTAGRDGYIFEQTFTNPIGTNSKGKPLYTIKVVIDGYGDVVTAFPKK